MPNCSVSAVPKETDGIFAKDFFLVNGQDFIK